MSKDKGCICKGNWRLIIKESEPLLGSKYIDENGRVYTFIGVMYRDDDYYYCLWRGSDMQLLSCVGSIEMAGYTKV